MNEREIAEVSTVPTETTDLYRSHTTTKRKLTTFVLGAGLFLFVLFLASTNVTRWSPFGIVLCTWALAIPILLNGVYHASIRRVLFINGLSEKGRIYWFCSGYVIRLIVHTILALCATIAIIMEVIYSPRPHVHTWSFFVFSAFVLYPVYSGIHRIVLQEVPDWHAGRISMRLSSVLVAIPVAAAFVLLTNFGTDYPVFDSVSSAISSQPQFIVNDQSIGLLLDYYSQARGAAEYAIGLLRSSETGSITYLLLYSTMVFLFFLGITSAMSTFCLPLSELVRSLTPTKSPLPKVSRTMLVLAIAIVVAVSVAYFYGFWNFTEKIENIAGKCVRSGTAAEVERMTTRYESLLRGQLDDLSAVKWTHIESLVDDQTAALKSNVDGFLDWYYGPIGELRRVGIRISGWIDRDGAEYEQSMIGKLHEFLLEDVPIESLDRAIEEYYELVDTLIQVTAEQYDTAVNEIVATNAIDTCNTGPVTVVAYRDSLSFGLADELRDGLRSRSEAFLQRQGVSVAFGAVAGAVATTLVGRAVYKRGVGNVGRLIQRVPRAARPLARTLLLGSRAITVGSGVGLLAMVVLTVGFEYALLKFHEREDRPQLKGLIFDAIDTSQTALKAELQPLVQVQH